LRGPGLETQPLLLPSPMKSALDAFAASGGWSMLARPPSPDLAAVCFVLLPEGSP